MSSRIYAMQLGELDSWVKNKADFGDIAYSVDRTANKYYMYFYMGPDEYPYWREMLPDFELNKLLTNKQDLRVDKKCETCKHFYAGNISDYNVSWCTNEKHKGAIVPNFTSCPEYEEKEKEKKSTPFEGMKFYLKDINTGELGIKYICEKCGKEMTEPDKWQYTIPVIINGKPPQNSKSPGFHFLCKDCNKKENK